MLEHPSANIRLQLAKALVKAWVSICISTYCQSTVRRPILESKALHEAFSALAVAAAMYTSTLMFRLALIHIARSLSLAFLRCLGLIPVRPCLVPCASLIGLRVGLLHASISAMLLGSWPDRTTPACRLVS